MRGICLLSGTGRYRLAKELLRRDAEVNADFVVLFQLAVSSNQRTAVLLHGAVLLSELISQHRELRFGSGDSLLKVLHPGTSQTEGGLGFLDLLV